MGKIELMLRRRGAGIFQKARYCYLVHVLTKVRRAVLHYEPGLIKYAA